MWVDSGKVVFGQHDATSYGIGWRGESARSDVKSVAGDYPGLINWDLGGPAIMVKSPGSTMGFIFLSR